MIVGFKVYIDKLVDGKLIHSSDYELCKGRRLWKLLVGIQQGKMNWYWTSEEVFSKIRKKR